MTTAGMAQALRAFWSVDRGRRLLSLLLALFVASWLLATLRSTGITDDDDFYAPAGIAYVEHLGRMLTGDREAYTRAGVDRAYSRNKEHPPLAKWAMGLSYTVLHRWTNVLPGLDAARAGVVALAAILAFLLASFVHAWRGPVAATAAVLALFCMPRFFFHSHVATLDVPVATLYFATCYAFWRGRSSRFWALASGPVFGLALLTKLNAPFALIPIVLFLALERWRQVRRSDGATLVLPAVPLSLLSMVIAGPLVFVALWPHLWFDSFQRIGAYVAFHLNHYPIYLYYLGHIYEKPFAPWHAPFVLAWATTPLVLVAAAAAGLLGLRGLSRFLRSGADEEGARALFVLLNLAVTIGVVAFLGAPKYGGVKLFLPFFPFVAALVGVGVDTMARALVQQWPRLAVRASLLPVAIAVIVIVPAAVATSSSHPFGLSYYGAGIGGLRGATAIGFERQYYDVADKELAAWLDANAPKGATLHFEPNNKEYVKTYRWLARDGYLRPDLRVVDQDSADLYVLVHERRWASYPELLARSARRTVAYEKRVDGVALYTVFRAR
ncbi:MAG: glycosyltransferase family 39 protein [Pseudomonadota bacterium]